MDVGGQYAIHGIVDVFSFKRRLVFLVENRLP